MSNSALEQKLQELHTSIVQELLNRVESGEAKPADISNAIKLLQHNNIQIGVAKGTLVDDLLHAVENGDFSSVMSTEDIEARLQ